MLLFQCNTVIVKLRTIREFIINNRWNNSKGFLFVEFTSSCESCVREKFQFFRLLYLERLGGKCKQKVLSRIVDSERKTETNFFRENWNIYSNLTWLIKLWLFVLFLLFCSLKQVHFSEWLCCVLVMFSDESNTKSIWHVASVSLDDDKKTSVEDAGPANYHIDLVLINRISFLFAQYTYRISSSFTKYLWLRFKL